MSGTGSPPRSRCQIAARPSVAAAAHPSTGAEEAAKEVIGLVAYRGAQRLEVTVGPGRVGVNLAER